MKTENIIYLLGAVLVLGGASLKFLHLPYAQVGDLVSRLTFIGVFFYLAVTNAQLKKKLKQHKEEGN